MKKKNEDRFIGVVIGLVALISFAFGGFVQQKMQGRLTTEKTTAEIRVEKYKRAEEVCGSGNVEENRYCDNKDGCSSNSQLKFEYICESMHRAVLSEEERAEEESGRLQERVLNYCNLIENYSNVSDFAHYYN